MVLSVLCLLPAVWCTQSNGVVPQFVEQPSAALSFRHVSPISPQRHIHLFMGSGLGWTDFDRDGQLDLLFCQGAAVDSLTQPPIAPALSLWRGSSGAFAERSQRAGFAGNAYAMGLTIADYDNDGFADVFVTGLFTAALYRNNGDGTFIDVTREAGIEPHGFGAGCCWTDWDRDGFVDLVYVRYLVVDSQNYPLCNVKYQGRDVAVSCNPRRLAGESDSIYRNRGDGRFVDASAETGFATGPRRQGLGCVALDLDDDGQVEVYVANDTSPNDLWKVLPTGEWEESGMLAGAAVNRTGAAAAGMGIAAGDINGDLRPDLYVTNYFNETNTLFRNEGSLTFLDAGVELGLAAPSRLRLGFGVTLADFDNDGWSDYFVANGHVQDQLDQAGIHDQPFAQFPQLLQNRGGRRFEDVSADSGPFFRLPAVARGTAAADVDGDGRIDLAVLRLNDRAAWLRNVTPAVGRWLSIELLGTSSNRDAIGATVMVHAPGQAWRRDRMASASYLSCDAPELHFGLGAVETVSRVTVRWPSGRRESFANVPIGARTRLVEGQGAPEE